MIDFPATFEYRMSGSASPPIPKIWCKWPSGSTTSHAGAATMEYTGSGFCGGVDWKFNY